ncbi:MAG: HAD family hydrolase [Aigarchaeota archaeon]|nr:HAD family hydrolase [Candidatus Pelearchaeum maunauluense]
MSQARNYFELRTARGLSYVRYESVERLSGVESAVFDCDGVLIDSRTSYDEAIRYTVAELVRALTGLEFSRDSISLETIYTIRGVGGFNNDWDTVHLLTTWLAIHAPRESLERLAKLHRSADESSISPSELMKKLGENTNHTEMTKDQIRQLLRSLEIKVQQYERTGMGYREIEEEVVYPELNTGDAESIIRAINWALGYPGKYGEGLLVTFFDEAFFGSRNIRNVRRVGPYFSLDGSLEGEKLLVDEETMRELSSVFRKMGLATGRGSWETSKTMGALLNYFEPSARVFIADLVNDDIAGKERYEKPSPYALIEAARGMVGDVMYVGDSAADLILWQNAKKVEDRYVFAGVYGGVGDIDRIDQFMEGGADLIIPSVSMLPRVMRIIREG